MSRSGFLISLLWLSLVAAPSHSSTLAEAAVRTSVFGDITTPICMDGGSGATLAMVSCSEAGNIGDGRARASEGSLATYARLYATAPPADNNNYQAYGWARFSDRIGLGSPLIEPGVSTNARLVVDLSGFVLRDIPDFPAPGTLSIPWTFTVKINGLELQPSNNPVIGQEEGWWYDFDITAGGNVLYSAELISDVRCFGCDGAYEGIADFWTTAIVTAVEVRDPVTGNFLDPGDFTITSLEGASYANVVPEPTTALLLACGLVGLAARRGRRQR